MPTLANILYRTAVPTASQQASPPFCSRSHNAFRTCDAIPVHRISCEELEKEIDQWRKQITECKTTMEEAEDLPQDFADQINVFIPVSSFHTRVNF